jgi:pre-mRNA 3'-end-processing factor FIP1
MTNKEETTEEDVNKFLYGDEHVVQEIRAAEGKLSAAPSSKKEPMEQVTDGTAQLGLKPTMMMAVDATENGPVEQQDEEEEEELEIVLDTEQMSSTQQKGLTSISLGGADGTTTAASSGHQPLALAAATSTLDVHGIGTIQGRSILEIDLDDDILTGGNRAVDKPWRRPGADLTDYFNFGFNEYTWRVYCLKQRALREEQREWLKALNPAAIGMSLIN